MARFVYTRGKLNVAVPVPKASSLLPVVVLILCLSLFGMAAVTLLTVGADPETGPRSLVTSTAAQGYQGLRRLLTKRGFETATNRFEDGDKGTLTRGDIEIITVDPINAVAFSPVSPRRRDDSASSATSSADSSSSETASASEEASATATPVSQPVAENGQDGGLRTTSERWIGSGNVPEKRRADHVLYKPLGRVVLVVLPKWTSQMSVKKPRWGQDARLLPASAISSQLTFLSPITEAPVPVEADDEADDEKSDQSSAQAASTQSQASAPLAAGQARYADGKASLNDGDKITTYDVVPYELRRAHTGGTVHLHDAGQRVFGTIEVGKISDLQSITGPNLTPVLLGPEGEAVISRLSVTQGRPQPKVPVYVIADPDLLNNQIFSDPKRVMAALQVINALAPPAMPTKPKVVFNLTFNGLAFDRDLIHALSRPPYLAIPLSLLILALGLMWAAFARFGPPVIEPQGAALGRGVKVLADNAARLMAISVKEAKLGPAYAQLVRDEALRLRGYRQANKDETLDELADRLGKLYGTTDSYSDLKARSAQILTVHQLIDLTQKLHAWKADMGQTLGKTERDGGN